MNFKFDLSTIATLIDWLKRFDGACEWQSPGQFLKETVCNKKIFVEKHLEMELFEKICRYRKLIEFMLNSKSLPLDASLIVHLYLLVFFVSKSTIVVIFESLKKTFKDKDIKDLIDLIDDEQFAATLKQNEEGEVNKETILGSLNEV